MPRDAEEREVLDVSSALERVQEALEHEVGPLWVAGEVFEYKGPHRSGHSYFSLKDERAAMRVILWKGAARRALRCELEEGRAVLARGRFEVYARTGALSFILEEVEDRGVGDLARRFELLRRKLQQEGLFDEGRKRPLPRFPVRVLLITGHPSAAAADVLRTWEELRAPFALGLRPARVQGAGSARDLVAALGLAARWKADLVLLARGGGSLEDLWSFNEEEVVRAVAACPVPVVCAVGHESDFTLCDFAADERAKTPTAAAQRVMDGWSESRRRLIELAADLAEAAAGQLASRRLQLDRLGRDLRAHKPDRRLARMRHALYQAHVRLVSAAEAGIRQPRQRLLSGARRLAAAGPQGPAAVLKARLEGLEGRLEGVSPLAVLGRGYALVSRRDRPGFLRKAAEAGPGDPITVRLAEGELDARVEESRPQ